MVDAACTSMPYNHQLCDSMVKNDLNIYFFGSHYAHTKWDKETNYNRIDHFYKLTNWLYRGKPRGFLQRYIKTIEHVFNMITFTLEVHRKKPGIIHFQWSQLPFIDRWFLRYISSINPIVFTLHNSTPSHGEKIKFGFLRKVTPNFLKKFDALIVHTKYSKKVIVDKFSLNHEKIFIIPHGLLNYHLKDDKSSKIVSNPYDFLENEKIILLFGGISPYKGLDILIKAYSILPNYLKRETRLLIVGRANMNMNKIFKLAKSLNIFDRIIWDLRFVSENEITSIFRLSTLIVLPYRHVDQSGVLMTLINYGKPIVASRLGGFEELLEDGKHGHLFTPGDYNDLAKSLKVILEDKELTKTMGDSVKKLADNWMSWDQISRNTLRIYQKAIKGEKILK